MMVETLAEEFEPERLGYKQWSTASAWLPSACHFFICWFFGINKPAYRYQTLTQSLAANGLRIASNVCSLLAKRGKFQLALDLRRSIAQAHEWTCIGQGLDPFENEAALAAAVGLGSSLHNMVGCAEWLQRFMCLALGMVQ